MTDVVVLIYVADEAYGRRLLRYLAGKKKRYLHAEMVTDYDRISQRSCSGHQKIVVLTDLEIERGTDDKIWIRLADRTDSASYSIFQYQKAETLFDQMMQMLNLTEESVEGERKTVVKKKRGVRMFFSPNGVGVTPVVSLFVQYLGRYESCLYINLTGFPIWYGETLDETPDFHLPGIDELLFMVEREDFVIRERQIRRQMGKAYLLPPAHHFKDVLDSTKEDWHTLLHHLQKECGYDHIVIELGALMEHTMELLELGDEVLMITQSGVFGKIQRHVWSQYCQMEGKKEWMDYVRYLILPDECREWQEMLERQPLKEIAENNLLMALIGRLLDQEGREEEDVCLWEDFG